MIVEFTDPTGAGKIALSTEVAEELLRRGVRVAAIHEHLQLDCPFLPQVLANASQHGVHTDLVLMPWLPIAVLRHPRFFLFSVRKALQGPETIHRYMKLRAVCRKLAIHLFLQRSCFSGWIVIWDELVVHTAHNILIRVGALAEKRAVERFAGLVPLPDAVVIVKGQDVTPGGRYWMSVPTDSRRWVQRTAERNMMVKEPTFIGRLLRDYYYKDGQPLGERNPKWLQNDYVKFVRFGEWRIQKTGQGVLAFIINNGYLDNPTFRGMRQQLMNAFTGFSLTAWACLRI